MSCEFHRCFPDWTFVRRDGDSISALDDREVELWTDRVGLLTLYRLGMAHDQAYRLRFANQIAVDLLLDEKALIELAITPDLPLSTRDHFIADQVLPRMLAHQGFLVLHAGAVRHDDSAIVILGKSGSGKSTLVASFDQAGQRLIGDDALVASWQDTVPSVATVYPSLRLLPDSIEQLIPRSAATTSVAHYTPKQRVQLAGSETLAPPPLPIRALFALAEPSSDTSIRVRRLSIADACMSLIENSFMLDPTDMERVCARLEQASAVARLIPTFEISYPRDFSRLPEVRDVIIALLN